jgi:uncharacterized protein YjiS (DUF1127 family)
MSLDEEKFLALDGLVQWTSVAITQADRLASRTVVIVPPATGVVLMIVGASAIRTPSANPPRTPRARAGQTGYRMQRIRLRYEVERLTEQELADMRLTREDALSEVQKPFWQR